MAKGGNMVGILNRLMDQIEQELDAEIDFGQLLEGSGTTVCNVRRMMPARAKPAVQVDPFEAKQYSGSA